MRAHLSNTPSNKKMQQERSSPSINIQPFLKTTKFVDLNQFSLLILVMFSATLRQLYQILS